MENTLKKIKGIYPLKEEHLALLTSQLRRKTYAKNEVIIRANKVEPYLYFIEKGAAMAFSEGIDNKVIFWFGFEGDIMMSYNSYVNQTPGYENIELLEDSVVYELRTDILIDLYNSHTALSNWGRKLAELELIKTEERYIATLFKSAAVRYQELLQHYPSLIKRVQLGHIASYLGITQVTLSRIRSEIR
ncbi:Crp/Fnr family transcriptional regulator [Pedobacter sp. AW31-3R]|uniref:Crp/Fnr family transcriptional regulator n=1 Tax=Pedobacter sp. AW31-3R TaxID=3445781 RepID=UPI003F9FF006